MSPRQGNPLSVGRDQELAIARDTMRRAVAGSGSVLFVAGESGAGKTMLLQSIATEAKAAFPNMLVGRGEGNAQTGVSDAYLPWREILWSVAGYGRRSLGKETASDVSNLVGRIIYEVGPDLVGTFIPFAGLGLKGLQSVFSKLRFRRGESKEVPGVIDQSRVFEQYYRVLEQVSHEKPLLLLLDDLHWADEASVALLFYVGRKINACPILAVCAYRPQELASVTEGRLGRLRHVINELRRYGAHLITLDWSAASEEERKRIEGFAKTLVDDALSPHGLPDSFIAALADRTGGNPLFLTEILRWLADRQQMIQEGGVWKLRGEEPPPESLPERVEAAVEERVGLLTEELKRLLTDASVEGQDFTAQVLATIHGLDERGILGRLVEDLGKAHQLIDAGGERALKHDKIVSLFRFRHRLMREHLYRALAESERRVMHLRVGECLEALYQESADVIAPQLARHFEIARDHKRALKYHLATARQASRGFAQREALASYGRALDVWNELHRSRETTSQAEVRERLEILREAGDVAEYLGDCTVAERYHREALAIAEELSDARERILALGNLGDVCRLRGDAQDAERYYRGVELLVAGDLPLEAELHCDLAELYADELKKDTSRRRLELHGDLGAEAERHAHLALEAAEKAGLWECARRAYWALSRVARYGMDFGSAVESASRSLAIAEKHGLNRHALNTLGELSRLQGHLDDAQDYYDRFRKWAEESGSGRERAIALNNLGLLCLERDQLEEAFRLFQDSLHLSEVIEFSEAILETRALKGIVEWRRGRQDEALDDFKRALSAANALVTEDSAPVILVKLARELISRAEILRARELLRWAEQIGAPAALVRETEGLVPPSNRTQGLAPSEP